MSSKNHPSILLATQADTAAFEQSYQTSVTTIIHLAEQLLTAHHNGVNFDFQQTKIEGNTLTLTFKNGNNDIETAIINPETNTFLLNGAKAQTILNQIIEVLEDFLTK